MSKGRKDLPGSAAPGPPARSLVYDWGQHQDPRQLPAQAGDQGLESRQPASVALNDETLRDGLQSSSVRTPSPGEKIELLHCMVALGIDRVNIGMPVAGARASSDSALLAQEVVTAGLDLETACAARTVKGDIEAVAEVVQRAGHGVVADCFIGSSPIRQHLQGWDLDYLLRCTGEAVTYARSLGLEVMFVTEDTVRAKPQHVARLYLEAVRAGARAVCVTDTVGAATPEGAAELVRFLHRELAAADCAVPVDWHGHNDRGLAVANSLAAARAGAHRLHGTGLGIGERAGNAAMDQLLVNFRLEGWGQRDLESLPRYCRLVSRSMEVPIPSSYPVLGEDAFRTATGVHAAALLKARRRGQQELEDLVYSSIPASLVGRRQRVDIGPSSGVANVNYWLTARGLEAPEATVAKILERAKSADRVLGEDEVRALLPRAEAGGGG
ncbi:MAG: LeuA family protein [Acidobacteriota bacterium]